MTNRRLEEILQMILEHRVSPFLCDRLDEIWNEGHINKAEFHFVNKYMSDRTPDNSGAMFWWGMTPDTGFDQWLQIKHNWLQNLINKL